MNRKLFTSAAVVLSMVATPVLAASANPAASLSVASSVRSGSAGKHSNKALGGAAILGLVVLAGAVAIPVVDAVSNNHDRADSN